MYLCVYKFYLYVYNDVCLFVCMRNCVSFIIIVFVYMRVICIQEYTRIYRRFVLMLLLCFCSPSDCVIIHSFEYLGPIYIAPLHDFWAIIYHAKWHYERITLP